MSFLHNIKQEVMLAIYLALFSFVDLRAITDVMWMTDYICGRSQWVIFEGRNLEKKNKVILQ